MENRRRIVVYDVNYPSPDNLYGDVFVQSRLLKYKKHCDIIVLNHGKKTSKYTYLDINVEIYDSKDDIFKRISDFKPDVLIIHFYPGILFDSFMKKNNIPTFIWVHGYEALGWYRRLFNFKLKELFHFSLYMLNNIVQLYFMRKVIGLSNSGKNIQFVFVSNWMRKIAEKDMHIKVDKYKIIPNPIDTKLFEYKPKLGEQRKKILLIRSFDSSKYANDIAINALLLVSKKRFFRELQITICGKGKLFDSLTQPLKKFPNVVLVNTFIPNCEIPNLHKSHGVFLCPTRQDAQGVSMCEAMSSGLVPITSNNTAIPEFVNSDCGYLTESIDDIVKALEELYYNESIFLEKSKKAHLHIAQISGDAAVIEQEIKMILNA